MYILRVLKTWQFWLAIFLLSDLRYAFRDTPFQFDWMLNLFLGGGAILVLISVFYDAINGIDPNHTNFVGTLKKKW
ncbi:hypothetical protein DIS17_02550 [Levilactobacillus brevis]|uniref:Uncharacterized protein n=1 Tax=Levilactobacillus brevis TaxID=1580 RepID=A0AAJ5K5F4_LEVBR|nr:hypothetical protein [Levilactobacillus brevis]AWP45737.1 hypothetical protein CCS05_01755 [Levilactobacillus brevis]RAY08471.1 hypothetical protein DN391_11225 [Levilactobacillus brevis]TOZ05555.1 hypothetical protein DIS17_02550 [Levilactobacillus brevis]